MTTSICLQRRKSSILMYTIVLSPTRVDVHLLNVFNFEGVWQVFLIHQKVNPLYTERKCIERQNKATTTTTMAGGLFQNCMVK